MATIGSLAVNIVATTDKFIAGLNNAQSRLGKFAKGITSLQGIVSGLAIAGLGAIVNSAVEAGGKMQELTSKLHISAEALSALHYAANQLESSAGAVDSAIAKMNVTLGQAAMGGKAATEAIERLGLDLNQILSLSVDQQFLAIVGALNKYPNAAEKAAAAQAIFGKGAKEIIPLINAGTEAIVAQGQAAADANAIMTTETMEALDQTGDAVTSLSATWDNLKTESVAAFAPILDWLAFLAAGVLKAFRTVAKTIQALFSVIVAAVSKSLAFIIDGLNLLLPKSSEIQNNFHAAADGAMEYARQKDKEIKEIWMGKGESANPLAAKKVEKNTEKTATAAERTASATEKLANQKPVQLAVAGVR